jgi:hypothetical protein
MFAADNLTSFGDPVLPDVESSTANSGATEANVPVRRTTVASDPGRPDITIATPNRS